MQYISALKPLDKVSNSGWGDWYSNTELFLMDGRSDNTLDKETYIRRINNDFSTVAWYQTYKYASPTNVVTPHMKYHKQLDKLFYAYQYGANVGWAYINKDDGSFEVGPLKSSDTAVYTKIGDSFRYNITNKLYLNCYSDTTSTGTVYILDENDLTITLARTHDIKDLRFLFKLQSMLILLGRKSNLAMMIRTQENIADNGDADFTITDAAYTDSADTDMVLGTPLTSTDYATSPFLQGT